jgi:uncharacterized protein YoxC
MEKKIPFMQFQSVKSVAKAIDPFLRQKARLEAQIEGLDDEFKAKAEELLQKLKEKIKVDMAAKKEKLEAEINETNEQIAAIEAGIVSMFGFHVTDLVKKVREPNEKGDLETKYVTTDIVSYDSTTKEFIVTVPDEAENAPETIVPPTTEEDPGSDFDADVENQQNEEKNDNQLPF